MLNRPRDEKVPLRRASLSSTRSVARWWYEHKSIAQVSHGNPSLFSPFCMQNPLVVTRVPQRESFHQIGASSHGPTPLPSPPLPKQAAKHQIIDPRRRNAQPRRASPFQPARFQLNSFVLKCASMFLFCFDPNESFSISFLFICLFFVWFFFCKTQNDERKEKRTKE